MKALPRAHGAAHGVMGMPAAFAWVAALALAGCAGAEPTAPSHASGAWTGERVATADRPAASAPRRGQLMLVSASGNYLAGSFAQRSRDFAAAADYFSNVLEVEAENRRIRQRAYLSLVASGRMKEALELAPDIVKRNPGAVIASLSTVIKEARDGRFAEASKLLEAIPRRGLNTFTVPLLLAWSEMGEGKVDQGLATVAKVGEIPNFAALAAMHEGLINDLAGRPRAAEAAYRKAMDNRSTLRVAEALGSFLERTGRPEEAKEVYESFLADNPESDAFDPTFDRLAGARSGSQRMVADAREGMAEVLFNLAGTLVQGRSTDPALIYGRLALYLKPDFPIAQMLVAGVLESVDRAEEAIAVYDEIDPKAPLGWSARLSKAGALNSLDRTDEAVALLRGMVDERTGDPDAAIRLGDMLRSKERFEEAIDAYTRALERVGTLERRHWSILYARGIGYERTKQWSKAEQDFLRALELSPDQPYVLNYLGYSWVDQGLHLERAQEMIERAVALRPNDGYIVDSLGWVLYRLGNYQGATEHLERAVTLRPEDPTINDHLGDAYWRVGRYTEARFQWKRALTLEPEKSQIPVIEAKLRAGLMARKPGGRPG